MTIVSESTRILAATKFPAATFLAVKFQQNYQEQQFKNQPPNQQANHSSVALEYIVNSLATSTHAFENETRASIKKYGATNVLACHFCEST